MWDMVLIQDRLHGVMLIITVEKPHLTSGTHIHTGEHPVWPMVELIATRIN